jgi:lactate racemase
METKKLRAYRIPYDDTDIELKIPEANVSYYMDLDSMPVRGTNRQMIQSVVDSADDPALAALIRSRHVGLIIEDATRTVPLDDLLAALGPHLALAQGITVILATGTHDGENSGNYAIVDKVKEYAGRYTFSIKGIVIHDCHQGPFYLAGTTSTNGNAVYANTAVQQVEVFIVLSDMKNHYFAGYSNALKNFVPGICAYQTVERNHALSLRPESTFGHHPLHPDVSRRDNPLARDIWEGYRLIVQDRPVFVVATIFMQDHVLWAGAGLLEPTVTAGIRQVDRMLSIHLPPADRLIVSCGGYPNDESLYCAQRALELSKNGIRIGGEILFLAGCRNGIGPEKSVRNFYDPLKLPLQTILQQYNRHYIMYAHKTYKFAQLITRLSGIHVMSRLTDREITDIHLIPCADPQRLVDRWITEEPGTKISIITEANKYAVHCSTT